ncbi:MAG: hypothetical protein EPO24_13370 [Bacteroidetes bacterium]|nr:MAG: hypothetical protein EPO24_13370 [Bacteroidota bacterium]
MKQISVSRTSILGAAIALCLLLVWQEGNAGKRVLIQLRDFTTVEVKGAGLTLPHRTTVYINALGGGKKKDRDVDRSDLFAYGWIINANTRERVWLMTYENTNAQDKDREFDGSIELPAGSYEVYFVAYGFQGKSGMGTIEMNIDRREKPSKKKAEKEWGPFSWFYGFFTEDFYAEWEKRAKQWGIDISLSDGTVDETTFNVPQDIPHTFFKVVKQGENDHVKQGFTLAKPVTIRVYALGEGTGNDEFADYGWIVDSRTGKRVWELNGGFGGYAGGARKNKKADETISLPAGEYVLTYVTDDSHSFADWNDAPPDDPFNYGITLATTSDSDKTAIKLTDAPEFKNVIAELTRIGNDETRDVSFTLKQETELRVYALGERSLSNRDMADYGWIINARTREKVWTMEEAHSEHAGGASKNRMVDEVITLPKGTYTMFYKTDDSHAYRDWNSSPPVDQKHWGITVMGAGEGFNESVVEKNVSPKRAGLIVQITQVRDDADKREYFKIDKPARVRIYSLGEGQNRQMYDYGWIENARTHEVVWEMTYGMTFHAGGARKNRMVNTTITLEKGEYLLRYVSDDSHSYNDWNTDAPDDPTMWGITVYKDDE